MATTDAPATTDMSVRTRDVRREAFDRRCLSDIERLALSRAAVVVDQTNVGRDVPSRQHVRQQAAQLAAADDRHLIHLSCAIVIGDMDSLRGKVAVVTGGSRGIGLAIRARACRGRCFRVRDGAARCVPVGGGGRRSRARARRPSKRFAPTCADMRTLSARLRRQSAGSVASIFS